MDVSTTNTSVLSALEDDRIVSFYKDGESLVVAECCDGYFAKRLSKEQVNSLIRELQEIYESM